MSKVNISKLIEKSEEIINRENIGMCISLLNDCGEKEFFIRLGEIKPCSIELSEKKALTSYQFTNDNYEIYTLLTGLGSMPLISENYCFIPGGKYMPNLFGGNKFLGVSSTDPSKDLEIANEIANFLYIGE